MQFLLISRDHAKILLRDGIVRILWYQTCLKKSLYMNKSGLIEITANFDEMMKRGNLLRNIQKHFSRCFTH